MTQFLLLFAMLSPGLPQLAEPSYAISGKVLDSANREAAGAEIELLEVQGDNINNTRRTRSRKDGSFTFADLSPVKYRVYVWQESAGVPYSRALIFQQIGQSFPETEATLRSSVKPLTLTLPPPYGTISGHIVDAQTGAQVPHARINLSIDGHPDVFSSSGPAADGSFVVQLPERLIRFSISAPGYNDWVYRSNDGTEGALLKKGSKIAVDVKLVHE